MTGPTPTAPRMCECDCGPNRGPCGKTYAEAVSDLMDRQSLNRYQAESIIDDAQVTR